MYTAGACLVAAAVAPRAPGAELDASPSASEPTETGTQVRCVQHPLGRLLRAPLARRWWPVEGGGAGRGCGATLG